MLESEPGGFDAVVVVKDDIQGELFAANTKCLATRALNLDFHEQLHLLVEVQH